MSIFHEGPISGVASSNGLVATAGYDNRVILWEAKGHTPLSRVWHDHLVNYCEFSPDGRLLVTASSDYSARIWTIPDLRLKCVLVGHSDDVLKASFSPDGSRVATCSYDSTLIVFRLDGSIVCECQGHSGLVETFDWNGDSQSITSCGTDGTIRTWCSFTGKQLTCVSGFEFDLDAIVVTAESEVWVGTDDGKIVGIRGDERVVTAAHGAGVKKIVCHGRLLVSLGYDHACVLWRRNNFALEEIARSALPPQIWARSAAFIDDTCVVFATFGSRYAVWNWMVDEWNCEGYVPSIAINAVAVGGDGCRYTIGDAGLLMRDGTVVGGPGTLCNCLVESHGIVLTAGHTGKVYNGISGEELYSNGAPVNCVSQSQTEEATRLIFGTYDGALLLFQNQNECIRFILRIQIGCSAVKGVCCDDKLIYCGSADGTLTVVSLSTYEILNSVSHAHDSILNGVAICREGFATISRDMTLRLWDTAANVRRVVPSRHPNSVKCICSDRDGNLLATGSYGGTIDIFDVGTDRWMGRLRRPTMSGISAIAWDERQSCFIASSYDGRVYNVEPNC